MGTNACSWPRGQFVTATTITTVTVAEDVGLRSYADGIRLICWDGCGYKQELTQNGTASGTTITVDSQAALANVGRSLDFDATRYAQAADNTIHQITTEDIGISAWVRVDSDAPATRLVIVDKKSDGLEGYTLFLSSGILNLEIRDSTALGGDTYLITGTTNIRDNKWHQVAGIIDRSNATNCKIYLDGYENGTTTKTGTLANVDSITNTYTLGLARRPAGSSFLFDGQIRDVILAYPADIMAAGEMGASGEILTLATTPRDFTTVNHEDAWALTDDAANTTVANTGTGSAPANLTASANTNTFSTQEAFISKSMLGDSGMEN